MTPRRVLPIAALVLKPGAHSDPADGMCLLEVVSFVAGEPFSDHPECVCPVLGAFGRAWNDGLPDDEIRTRLLVPFIPRLIGTRSTPDVQNARAFMATDWAVRTYTPVWLRAAGLDGHAAALAALPALSSVELCRSAMPIIDEAKKKAYAAWAAAGAWPLGTLAGDAAGAAAWDAARDAAWAAAWDAGDAAGDAARDAARDAAWAAAWDAAWAAAWAAAGVARDALRPLVELLQTSAVDLFDRMINLTEVTP